MGSDGVRPPGRSRLMFDHTLVSKESFAYVVGDVYDISSERYKFLLLLTTIYQSLNL